MALLWGGQNGVFRAKIGLLGGQNGILSTNLALYRCKMVFSVLKCHFYVKKRHFQCTFRRKSGIFRAKMVESRSCSRVWDQNNPQTVLEIGSTPHHPMHPGISCVWEKLFFHPTAMSRGGGVTTSMSRRGGVTRWQLAQKSKILSAPSFPRI